MKRAPKLISATAAAAAVLAALAPAAFASTATITNGTRIAVNASGNVKNQILLSYGADLDVYTVTDATGIDGSGACVDLDANTVNCPGASIASVTVNSGAGNDTIALDRASWPGAIEGNLNGGTGDDRVSGTGAADALSGSSGRDILDGGDGSDDLRGAGGTDAVVYADRTTPLAVTVGAGNDNDGNELDQTGPDRDTVHGDIETVLGGSAADILIGDPSDETLYGGEGADVLLGGGGRDTLLGVGGNDFLSGEGGGDLLRGSAGNDRLLGGSENDRLAGGPDNDVLRGGPGVDAMKGKGGIDIVQAKDGFTDRNINCGSGGNRRERAKRDKRLDPGAKSC